MHWANPPSPQRAISLDVATAALPTTALLPGVVYLHTETAMAKSRVCRFDRSHLFDQLITQPRNKLQHQPPYLPLLIM